MKEFIKEFLLAGFMFLTFWFLFIIAWSVQ